MTSSTPDGRREPGLVATVVLYTLARLVLVAIVAALLALAGVPVVLAVLIGLIVALPLSMVLFRGLRTRLDTAIAVSRERRGAEREALRARLRGDVEAEPASSDVTASDNAASDDAGERQPHGGQG